MKSLAERIHTDISKTYQSDGEATAFNLAFQYQRKNSELFEEGYCPACEVDSLEIVSQDYGGCVICGSKLEARPIPEEGAMKKAYENTYGIGIDPEAVKNMYDTLINIEPTLVEQLSPEFWKNDDILNLIHDIKVAIAKAKHSK